MEEIWKAIPGYDGYEVSNLGNVKSLSKQRVFGKNTYFTKEKILKPLSNGKGYYQVEIYKKRIYIHQLVAISFLNHKKDGHKLVVDHINDIKTDNRLENLQIVTQRENNRKTQGNYSSQYKGVNWQKGINKWRAKITINNKQKHLGVFNSEYEAHLAYQNKLKEIENNVKR